VLQRQLQLPLPMLLLWCLASQRRLLLQVVMVHHQQQQLLLTTPTWMLPMKIWMLLQQMHPQRGEWQAASASLVWRHAQLLCVLLCAMGADIKMWQCMGSHFTQKAQNTSG
jgi:hypothetical protein